ncbi:MAG: hypothetical protein O3B73_01840 [bacterium]|nr:hypothetical protein [bacterium]
MKAKTIRCVACPHLRIAKGAPVCGHCDRLVTPGNVCLPRAYLPEYGVCRTAWALRPEAGPEVLAVEAIFQGYV